MKKRTRKQGASLLLQTSATGRGRHWRALLSAAGIALAAYYFGQLLHDPSRFPVRDIAFSGQFHYLDRADLQQRTAQFREQSFFDVDLQSIRKAVMAAPWIKDAALQRLWPDRVLVVVEERRVFARWGEHELLDIDGKRFDPQSLPQGKAWPHLEGPDGQEQNLMLTFQEASAMLAEINLSIRALRQDSRWSWSLTLDNGIQLILGRRDISLRLQRFIDVFEEIVKPRSDEIAALDLRYRNGFAVRWVKGIDSSKTVAGVRVRASVSKQLNKEVTDKV